MNQQNKPVYKYRGGAFERDLSSLINNEIYAPTVKELNDPCEGFISTNKLMNEIDEMLKINPQATESMNIFKDELNNTINHIETSGIYSLSKNHLDELLWAHYANSHKGFCIEYDLKMLLKLNKEIIFKNKELLVFADIKYRNQPYHLTVDDMNNLKDATPFMEKLLGYKSKRWEYENEVRIICSKFGSIEYDYRAVKSIYFGLKMEKEEENKIIEKLQGRGINYYKIKLKKNSYKFYAEPVEDLYKIDKKYLYSIAEVMPCTIKDINTKNPYIQKAIEIVRREPYCNSIINIKEKNNSIEVYFFKEHPITLKQEYTYNEIDKLYSSITDLEDENITK